MPRKSDKAPIPITRSKSNPLSKQKQVAKEKLTITWAVSKTLYGVNMKDIESQRDRISDELRRAFDDVNTETPDEEDEVITRRPRGLSEDNLFDPLDEEE